MVSVEYGDRVYDYAEADAVRVNYAILEVLCGDEIVAVHKKWDCAFVEMEEVQDGNG